MLVYIYIYIHRYTFKYALIFTYFNFLNKRSNHIACFWNDCSFFYFLCTYNVHIMIKIVANIYIAFILFQEYFSIFYIYYWMQPLHILYNNYSHQWHVTANDNQEQIVCSLFKLQHIQQIRVDPASTQPKQSTSSVHTIKILLLI